jgi:hypothetical protein
VYLTESLEVCCLWSGVNHNYPRRSGAWRQVLSALSESSIQALRQTFKGTLIGPGDDGYEEARKVWNGAIDKRPGLIARFTATKDVVAAANFGRDNGVLFAVQAAATVFRGTPPARAGSSSTSAG